MSNKSFRTQSTLKLALLSALALGAVAASVPALAANSTTVTATANVVVPIALTPVSQISFGKFAPDASAGSTVTVFTDGTRSVTGSAFLLSGSPGTGSQLDVSGEGSATYAVNYSAVATQVTSGANNMPIAFFSSNASEHSTTSGRVATGTLSGGGAQSIFLGATLTVGANQAAGTYTGNITVSVDYN